jgi:protein ImuB
MPPTVVPWFVAIALPGWSRPRSTLARMAEWCMRFTPRVHVEDADPAVAFGTPLVLLDASGCLRVNGGAGRLVRRVGRGLSRRGIAHAIGSAPSGGEAVVRATAAALGRAGGAGAAFSAPDLDSLPVEALRLAERECEALREVNLRRIGELRAISRAALADRFGPALLERIDMAGGALAWPFRAVPAPAPVVGEFAFASPCAQREAVDLACRQAVAMLCESLDARRRGVRSLAVRIERARLAPVAGTLHFGAPTRDPAHLWSLLAPRIERVHLGHHELGEGIERIVLIAQRLGRCAGGTPLLAGELGRAAADAGAEAAGNDRRAESERAVGELVDQLRARLGEARVVLVRERPDAAVPSNRLGA